MKKIIVFLALFTFCAISVFAQDNYDMTGNLGIGYTSGLSAPAIGVKYWVAEATAFEVYTGFKAGGNEDVFLIGGKVSQVIKTYKSLNLYAAGSLEADYHKPENEEQSTKCIIGGGVGVEWFVLNNLSLAAEVGLRLSGGDGKTSFGTFADGVPSVSVKFYL